MARTMRNFRLDDDVYAAAQDRARREYTNVTAVVERYLAEYAGLIGSGNVVVDAYQREEAADQGVRSNRKPRPYSKERQARGKRP